MRSLRIQAPALFQAEQPIATQILPSGNGIRCRSQSVAMPTGGKEMRFDRNARPDQAIAIGDGAGKMLFIVLRLDDKGGRDVRIQLEIVGEFEFRRSNVCGVYEYGKVRARGLFVRGIDLRIAALSPLVAQ